jgi:hypothetical protein
MLKIVDVHLARSAQGEYVVLQNQGLMNVNLRGWALCTDSYLEGDPSRLMDEMYIFRDNVLIKPYGRVVLFTGEGENEWVPTDDGKQAYCMYWKRNNPVWNSAARLHVLHLQASRTIEPQPVTPGQTVQAQN